MPNFLSWLTGGGESSEDAAERQLIRSARGTPLETKGAPVVGRSVQNDSAEDFLRGLDFFRKKGGLARPYEASGWVQQAIKLVANPILAVPLRFAMLTAKGAATVVQDTQLSNFWRTPAVGPAGPISWAMVVSATVGWMKLAGEAFWIGDDTWISGRAGPRNPFFIARPDQMFEVMTDPTNEFPAGELLGWRFRDRLGRDHALVPEQVFQPKLWNPYHPVRGLGEYAAAAIAAESDVAAAEFARNLMQSNGDRGPIVSIKDNKGAPLSKAQQDQVEASIREKMNQVRSGGMPRPMFLTADVSIAQPEVTSADSDFVAVRVENRKEVYMIFGVPSSFAEQMHRATSAHESDRFNLIEQTCIPTAAIIAGTVEQMARNMKGLRGEGAARLTAFFDWDEHSTMVQVRSERVEAWAKLMAGGMPPVLAGQYLGMRLPSWKGDDVSLVPLAIQTLEEVLDPPEPPPVPPALPPVPPAGGDGDDDADGEGTTEEDTAADAEEKALRARMLAILSVPAPGTAGAMLAILDAPAATTIPVPDATAPEPTAATLARAASDDARERLWRKHAKVRVPAEKQFGRVVKNALWSARGQVLAKLQRTKAAPALATKDDDDKQPDTPRPHPGTALDVMFDPVTFALELGNGIEKVGKVVMQQAGQEVRAEMGVDDPWTMEASDVFNAVAQRANLINGASADLFEEVRSHLEEGFAAGETTDQLAARVRSVFNDLRGGRAKTIAVTETGAAYGGGREAGAASIGYKTKSWLSAHDTHVRPTHQAADGQVVDARGNFTVGADSAPYPCAEGMSASEACNCRCVVLYHT